RLELTQLLSVKSMSRNLPPKGTAAFDRPLVKGCSLSPAPPAIIIASTLFIADFFLPLKESVIKRQCQSSVKVLPSNLEPWCNAIESALGLSNAFLSDAYQFAAQSVSGLMAVAVPMLVVPAP
ncbi:MAG: hypothetical protein PHU08_05905, partial [Dehalococcoidales bacterium]|nr:hypothetical protein [Dehalococcoidales bacterium]